MAIPNASDVKLETSDFLPEKEYDRMKVGIISKVVGADISLEYKRGENYCYPNGNGFKVVKAYPKAKGIDGNSALNHELAHVLFNSFDKRAMKTIDQWSKEWDSYSGLAHSIYMEAMNVVEDQRIESLWGSIYRGNVKDFVDTRKRLGKDLVYVNVPSLALLAERFFRRDLVNRSPYSFMGKFVHDVEGKDLKATMLVLRRIKQYLDEQIDTQIEKQEHIKALSSKFNELSGKPDVESQRERSEVAKELTELKNEQKTMKENNNIERRNDDIRTQGQNMEDVKPYDDDELGADSLDSYESEMDMEGMRGEELVEEVRESLEMASKNNRTDNYSISKVEIPSHQVAPTVVNERIVKDLKKLLKSFKEKSREILAEDGDELDIGEYINLKANGYGDCFVDETKKHGLSIVIALDGSGSMNRYNPMVKKMVTTLWKAVEEEDTIELKLFSWSSTRTGGFYIREYNRDDIQYLEYQHGGFTPTQFGIAHGSNVLKQMKGRRKLLIVLTDGYPNYFQKGTKIRKDMVAKQTIKEYKKALRQTPNITIVGFGRELYGGSDMTKMFGNRYIRCESMDRVETFLASTLRKEIIKCMKR